MPSHNMTYGFETRAIHAGAAPDPVTGARSTPIYQTTSYVFDDVDHAASLFNLHNFGYVYSRLNNPTVAVLEERVASLEGGRAAVAAASGHAAQFLIFFTLMEAGDEFIASRNLYGGSLTQFGLSFKKLGWKCQFVDPTDPENFRQGADRAHQGDLCREPRQSRRHRRRSRARGGDRTRGRYSADRRQHPRDPLSVRTHRVGRRHRLPFDDQVLERPWPRAWAASSSSPAASTGRRATGFPSLTEPEPAYHGLKFYENFGDFAFTTKARAVALRDFGPTLSPMNAFLTITGIETLHLRMERHVANALRVAEFLSGHPRVAWVSYAGLKESPFHDLARKYLPRGAGAVFTFGVKGGYEAGIKLVESVQLFSHLANIGDTRSLILHPASTTHRQLTDEQRQAAGAGPDVIRLSIGLESAEDLIRDLDEALSA